MNNNQSVHQSYLFVGSHCYLVDYTKQFLKQQFCKHNACNICVICKQIDHEQFHGAIWLAPENQYTLESLEPITKQICFALDQNEKLFFIIQHAQALTTACSNSLLKSVEEPPAGYHFIFLAQQQQQILPTIQSRCVIQLFYQKDENNFDDLGNIFKQKVTCSPSVFLKLVTQASPHERETVDLLNDLFEHWLLIAKQEPKNNYALNMIKIIKHGLEHPPMPGSSKLFWKNFYLQTQL